MKLVSIDDRDPKKDGLYFMISTEGYLGLGLFEEGKWYSMPNKHDLCKKITESLFFKRNLEFYWIDNEVQKS